MKEIKSKIEALLFCTQEGMNTKNISRLCGVGSVGHVKNVILSLQEDYKKRGSGMEILEKDGLWFLTVSDQHLNLVRKAAKPEMEKAVLQTLGYIAHKKNIRQSDVIRVRSNKAYEHIKELEERNLIEAKKDGSTRRLSPTKNFYRYFDLKENETLGV